MSLASVVSVAATIDPVEDIIGPVRTEFSLALKRARLDAGLSQRELATLVEINPETVNRLENGGNARVDTIEKIRRVLPSLVLNSDPAAAQSAQLAREALAAQQIKDRLAEMKTQTIHLIEAIVSIDRLKKIQAVALRHLTQDLKTRQAEVTATAVARTKRPYTRRLKR